MRQALGGLILLVQVIVPISLATSTPKPRPTISFAPFTNPPHRHMTITITDRVKFHRYLPQEWPIKQYRIKAGMHF